jgi:hypothetical protein
MALRIMGAARTAPDLNGRCESATVSITEVTLFPSPLDTRLAEVLSLGGLSSPARRGAHLLAQTEALQDRALGLAWSGESGPSLTPVPLSKL